MDHAGRRAHGGETGSTAPVATVASVDDVSTLSDLCTQVIARRNLQRVPDSARPDGIPRALATALVGATEHVEHCVRDGMSVDEIAGAALHLAGCALPSLDPPLDAHTGEQLAPLVLSYPSQTAWWDEPDSGSMADDARAVEEWCSRVRTATDQAVTSDPVAPIAGDSVRNTAVKALIRLCVEFAGWAATDQAISTCWALPP
jgi:hypothetical protein